MGIAHQFNLNAHLGRTPSIDIRQTGSLAAWLLFFSALFVGSVSHADPITLYTEEKPPNNFTGSDGKVTGLFTEIVKEIFKQAKLEQTIEVVPWARGYDITLKNKDVGLFATAKTPAREALFHWVGPIVKNHWYFFAKDNAKINITSLEQAKQFNIGVYNQSSITNFLVDAGFSKETNLDIASKDEFNPLKLKSDRIQLWATSRYAGYYSAKLHDIKIKAVFLIKEGEQYLVFNKQTDEQLVNKLQVAFDEIKDSQKVKDIYKKYGYEEKMR